MEKILYKLDSFEGPLDLLLHLIQKNKVQIYDIPIAQITDQYLEIIAGFEEEQLDNTSEFLVMAAQLLYIKSKMLLPKPADEEEEDPREDLARRLVEYQKYKEASMELRKQEFWSRYMVFRDSEQIDFPIPQYDRAHQTTELIDAFAEILRRRERKAKPSEKVFRQMIGREKVSVDDMVAKVHRILSKKRRVQFKTFFRDSDSKPEIIATFLAILELIKLNKISAQYDAKEQDFMIDRV